MKVIMMLALAASLLIGQEPKKGNAGQENADQQNFEAVIIPVKTLSGDSFNRLVRLLSVFNARITADDRLRTIIVYAPKEVVAQVRKVVDELDRPGSEAALGRNIEMTMTFLRCFAKAPTEAHPLPADLESVGRQLRAATQCKDVQMWDTLSLHLQEGKITDETLRLPNLTSANSGYPSATIRVEPEAVTRKDQGRSVRFNLVRIGLKIPYATGGALSQFMDVGLTTSGDFIEGQKTVLGKVSALEDESAIFVVIALKVLD